MSRLYDVRVDQKRWKAIEVHGDNYHTYKVIDDEKKHVYFFPNIIGFEQVGDDEFLVYRRCDYNHFQILRVVCRDGAKKVSYSQEFSEFEFVDEDKILLKDYNNRGSYLCGGIYSISENKLLEEANWLKYKHVEAVKDDEGNILLCLEEEIVSVQLGNKKVIFSVDPKTMKPTGCCYSELRDEFIEVSSKEDIDKIVKADERTIDKCEKEILDKKREKLAAAKKMVLSRTKKVQS